MKSFSAHVSRSRIPEVSDKFFFYFFDRPDKQGGSLFEFGAIGEGGRGSTFESAELENYRRMRGNQKIRGRNENVDAFAMPEIN